MFYKSKEFDQNFRSKGKTKNNNNKKKTRIIFERTLGIEFERDRSIRLVATFGDPRFADSIPAGVDGFFQSVKILSMTSFGREVKPWIPCRRFTARKRTSSRN